MNSLEKEEIEKILRSYEMLLTGYVTDNKKCGQSDDADLIIQEAFLLAKEKIMERVEK